MPTRKRNEYLDADSSSEDNASSGYDSELAQQQKGGVRTKRQKKTQNLIDEEAEDISEEEEDSTENNLSSNHEAPTQPQPQPSSNPPPTHSPTAPKPPPKPKGVIYLSRIPPYMKPSTVRTLLTPYGAITRLFLTPEPPSQHTSRLQSGGNRKKKYTDGWVEFSSRRAAKTCVEAINGRIVGGKKGGYYRDDVWNARYLRGFAWADLMESVRREEREREEKVRVGVRREGRERREFLRGVERGKVVEGRRRKRMGREGKVEEEGKGVERGFRQNKVVGRGAVGETQSEDVKRVLSKIF